MPHTHTVCPKCSDPLGKTISVMVRPGLQLSVYKCPYCTNVWATAADVPDSRPRASSPRRTNAGRGRCLFHASALRSELPLGRAPCYILAFQSFRSLDAGRPLAGCLPWGVNMTGTGLAALLGALCLTLSMSACENTSRTPLSPTVGPTPPPVATGTTSTLSGVVFEVTAAGNVPVPGVEVYCDACGMGHAMTSTDTTGLYRFSDVAASVYPLFLSKRGYTLASPTGPGGGGPDGWMGSINARVSGDTRFDIQLVRQ